MPRFTFRAAFTALALTLTVGAAALAPGEASAKGFHGGGFHGGGKFHGHVHGGFRRHWGPSYVRFVGYPYLGGCVVKRVVTYDGDLLLRKVCY